MISITIDGDEHLQELLTRFGVATEGKMILGIVEDELVEFAKLLYLDPKVPKEYSSSLATVLVEEMNTVALVAWGQKYWENKRFGSKLEWMIYRCPKRKYFGGELALEYNGPDYLKEQWKTYRPIFIEKVRSRIISLLREGTL
jgi:hypothetical protein